MGGLNELEAVAVRQWGLITRAQAVAVGLSPVALRWRVQTGALERVHSDVFRFRGAPPCWRQQALALALQCGPGSTVSHQSAAFLYDLWGISDKNRTPPRPIDVTTSRSRNPGHLEGVRLHRSRGDFTVEMRSGVPVTSVARTLVDLCDVLSEENLAMALDSARKGHPLIAPQLHALAATLLPIAAAFSLFDGLQVVAFGILRGAGDLRVPSLANLLGYWVLGRPLGAWLAFEQGWGAVGVWTGLATGLASVAVLLVVRIGYVARRGAVRMVLAP